MKILTFENNPWQCPCLKSVIGWSRRRGIQIHSNLFNGLKPVCVQTPEEECVRNATFAEELEVREKYLEAIVSEFNVDEEF